MLFRSRVLDTKGSMTQSLLANEVGIRPASLSEALDRLEDEKMIKRTKSKNDRRAIVISLTDNARDHIKEHRIAQEKFAGDFLSPLTEKEKQQLYEILNKLNGGNSL